MLTAWPKIDIEALFNEDVQLTRLTIAHIYVGFFLVKNTGARSDSTSNNGLK
jgi:hypothetical protein